MTEHKHTDAEYERELDLLRQEIAAMGRLVDSQVESAMKAFVGGDPQRARAVIAEDRLTNRTERAIDEQCVRMLALRQPAASDLRLITSVLKIVTDLERIGDLAAEIAERAMLLVRHQPLRTAEDVPRLCTGARSMLRQALGAFVALDPVDAEAMIASEKEIHILASDLIRETQGQMAHDSTTVERGVATIVMVRDIERIAAHATNIAEMAIYCVQGRDVRHANLGRSPRS